jgi:hypothetical protein
VIGCVVPDLAAGITADLGKQPQDHSVHIPGTSTNSGLGWPTAAYASRSTFDCIAWSVAVLAGVDGAPGRIRTCDTRFRKGHNGVIYAV